MIWIAFAGRLLAASAKAATIAVDVEQAGPTMPPKAQLTGE
jgi:hypothetical protein